MSELNTYSSMTSPATTLQETTNIEPSIISTYSNKSPTASFKGQRAVNEINKSISSADPASRDGTMTNRESTHVPTWPQETTEKDELESKHSVLSPS